MKLVKFMRSSQQESFNRGSEMSSTKAYSRTIGLLLGAAILLPTLSAQAIVVDATADIWIRENSPNTSYPDDYISVWGTPSTDIRHGVVEFDLSGTIGETLNSVFLNLFDPGDSRSQTQPIVQQAYIVNPTPPSIGAYTWAEYQTWDAPNEVQFDSLGSYNIPVGEYVTGYNASEFGSTADIALLESVRDNNAGRVVFILKATDGQRDWYDIELGERPPQLIFNQAPPIFGDLDGNGVVDENDLAVITDPDNWLQDVPPGTRGDLTGNGRVGLADFHAFKQIFQQHQPSAVAVVPEPTTLAGALIVLGGSLFVHRRYRNQ